MVTSRARRRVGVVVAVLVAGATALLGGSTARAASSTGDVYVVQGLADTPAADIFVDGKNVAPAAAPKTIVGPLTLSAGNHVVTLKDGATTLVNAQFSVKAGSSSDVVAHRTSDAQSQRVITVFPNDLSAVAPGKLRLVVSHVAVAPPADIIADSKPLFRNVANGESLSLVLPAMQTTVQVVPTATSGPAILGPVTLSLKAGSLTRVFAIGDATQNSTDAVVQVLSIPVSGAKVPTKVRTGDGGQTADSIIGSGTSTGTLVSLAVGLLLVAGLWIARGSASAERVIGSRHAR